MTLDPVIDAEIQRAFTVGDRVRIERDETLYPSKGTWPQFRGRIGTVVEVNTDRKRPHLTEFGVVFGKARTDGRGGQRQIVTWFKLHEIRALAPVRHAERRQSTQRDYDLAATHE